ncbi:cache domain-containing protein [Paenibacillus sp. PL2-23]|uniref:cache domain-containing sensor histidine kinase n=1 Tax=Paenibacillus sp. PL2-23 TaxID=2100729 RepID=UPI0030F8BA26
MSVFKGAVRFPIKVKLTMAFLSISMLGVILMAVIAHVNYSNATKKDFYTIADQAVTRTNHQIDLYFKQLEQAVATTIAGPINVGIGGNDSAFGMIQKWLNNPSNPLRQTDVKTIEDILNRYIAFNYSEIAGMFIVSNDGQLISSTGTSISIENLKSEPWYSSKQLDRTIIIPTYYTNFNSTNKDTAMISLIIPINSTETLKPVGKLIICMKLSEISRILGQTNLGDSGYFFIAADDGTIVHHPEVAIISQNLSETSFSTLDFDRRQSIQDWDGKTYLLSYHKSEFTGWKVIAFVPFSEMANGLTIATKATLVAGAALFCIILITVPIMSNRLVRPILSLKNAMLKVQRGDLHARADVRGGDELQVLNHAFNQMTVNLEQLIQTVSSLKVREVNLELKQKEALIQALQNQINPHLLYNTLDIIKSIAYLEEVPVIEKMCANLASIYRYTASLPEIEVELQKELDHVRKYLEIIHIRFTMHFQSNIYIHEKYLSNSIIKFSIQPIVENVVKYAVEPRKGKAAVLINAYPNEESLIIEIADNGPGIPDGILQSLQEKLASISNADLESLAQMDTVGIVNVHTRLVLQYGKQYGLKLDSFAERGTIVSIRIPFTVKLN